MARTRIRWGNVGRLAGGIAVGGIALFAAVDVLEPPPAEPLPADVGLASGASGFQAYEPPPEEPHEPDRRPQTEPPPGPTPPRDRQRTAPPQRPPQPSRGAADPPPQPQGPSSRSPSPLPAAPPPPPPPRAPEPDHAEPVRSDVKEEFGFEPRR